MSDSTRRLFFSLRPDARQHERLATVIDPAILEIEGTAVARENWHLTLLFLGSVDEDRIPELLEAAETIHVEPFELRLDRVEYWPRPRVASLVPAVMPTELARLAQQLRNLAGELDLPIINEQYRPHFTIARNVRPFETLRPAQTATIPWSDFELMESSRVHGEVRYLPLKQSLL